MFFLPNKTAGAFCSISHKVLPNLFGESLLRRMNVIISDIDSQEIHSWIMQSMTAFPASRE
jgi:hypothetical protein